MKFLKKLFGDENSKMLKKYEGIVASINALEEQTKQLSDADFKTKTAEWKQQIEAGETTLDDILPEAFALVREAAWRTMKMRHYDVQLIGGAVLHHGKVAEMRTGEGKTLVATLPTYLNALSGKGVHVVTVNDYLAKRDADWMGQIYDFLGLTVGVIAGQLTSFIYDADRPEEQEGGEIDQQRDEIGSFKIFGEYLRPCTRQEAYQADITYGTNNEFGFDYLRDNTQYFAENIVQREHSYVLIDEVDSVLIDEARVPLILSRAAAEAEDLYGTFASVARQLKADEHYELDEKMRAITLTDAGIERAEQLLKVGNIYTTEGIKYVHHLENAIRAKAVFLRDRDYVVKDRQVIIVDPFTGRLQEGRRYSDGMHQALEAKENVKIQQESQTLASITYQNYFRFYDKLSGMTGTAISSQEEFHKVYGLDVVVIPTNKPIARQDNVDLIYQTENGKFQAIARKVKELNEKGQPVLIGTVSVEKNEMLSAYLTKEGIKHNMLNAKNHETEGLTVAQAGRKGAVTIATNMAGRGVDIKLGGNPATPEQEQEIKDLGGLFVLATERHDARRIDNQLRGRSGRQGDPGETQFYVSLDDSLMRVFGSDRVKGMMERIGIPEDQPIQNKFIANQLEKAQEKIEGFNFDARKHVLSYDDVLSTHRNTIYDRRRKMMKKDQEYLDGLYGEIIAQEPEAEAGLSEKREALGEEKYREVFRRIALQVNDMLWMQHLQVMDRARQSVNLRAYGQREPIVEYKKEGLRLFREMEASFLANVMKFMKNIQVEAMEQSDDRRPRPVAAAVPMDKKYGRNDKVTITKDGQDLDIKFKKFDTYAADGWRIKT